VLHGGASANIDGNQVAEVIYRSTHTAKRRKVYELFVHGQSQGFYEYKREAIEAANRILMPDGIAK
jgi:hypothetical protein